MPLFRSESEASRADAWLGRILLIRPVSFTALTGAAAAVALSLAAFFVFGEYTRKARVPGALAPAQGVVQVVAPQAGVVHVLLAREGLDVARGEALLAIGDARRPAGAAALGEAVAARVAERERALARQRAHALAAMGAEQGAIDERREGIAREAAQVDVEIGVQEDRLRLARRDLDRASRLAATGFVSPAAHSREHGAALEQEARVQALRRSRLALARESASLAFEAGHARARAREQIAALDAQQAALEQERIERAALYRATIAAPAAGTIATVLVEPGQAVAAGAPLATILPAGASLEAHLFAPSRSIGFAREGQAVLIRYLAYPHQKFGTHTGRIAAIARSPMSPADYGFAAPDGSREPLYRIKVALPAQAIDAYGRAQPLQAGMRVEADIHLDRRSLLEWVFEPLLSLAGRA